jgi:hypothetical protein
MARTVPGFGGGFVDPTGTLNVWILDPKAEGATRQALSRYLQGNGRSVDRFRFIQATYTFEQLDQWQTDVANTANLEGIIFFGIDEVSNRLRVGLNSAASEEVISERLVAAGIPQNAVIFEVTRAPVNYQTL